jgi:hypothetical protein
MRLYLESFDLYEHADGTAEPPASTANAKTQRSFKSKAKKAWTYICLSIEPEQQIHVRETKNAKEAWDALRNQFARESLLQKVRLRQQYYSCRFRSGENMLEHISRLRSLHDQLREMGVEIDDKELAMTFLASLPEDYKPLVTALDAVGEGELSYEKVKNMLLNDVDRSNDTKNCEDAFSARRGKFGKYGKSWYGSGNTKVGGNTKGSRNTNQQNDKVFRENVTLVKKRDILLEISRSEIVEMIHMVPLEKKPSSTVLLVVLKTKALICLSMMKHYQCVHLV